MSCYTEKEAEHRPQKIAAANKERKEGRNNQESDAPSQTHIYGQLALHVSENGAHHMVSSYMLTIWAHHSHRAE